MQHDYTIILWLVAIIAAAAITYYWWRWIFSVEKQLWNQKQMIKILLKMAEKQGINDDELHTIKDQINKQ